MKSTPWFAFWQAILARPGAHRRRPTARGPGRTRRALVLEQLEDRSLPSATTTIGALGDSITAPYPPQAPWGRHGDQSWAQQLDGQGYKHLRIENAAVPGATSSDLLIPGGQVAVMADLVSSGAVQYVTLIVGANDLAFDYVPQIIPQIVTQGYVDPSVTEAFVTDLTHNIESALNQVTAAAAAAHVDVGLAVGNIPNIALTPGEQFALATDPNLNLTPEQLSSVLQSITTATLLANNEIEHFAAQQGIPVIDLYGLGLRAADAGTNPVIVGGVPITNLYAPDFFHPNTVGQGLLANTVLEALATAYHDPRLLRFRLTDQEILAEAGIAHRPGHTYFDVSPYVIYDGGHGREGATASRGDGHSLARPAPGGHTGQTTVLDELFAESGASPLGAAAVWDFPVTRSR